MQQEGSPVDPDSWPEPICHLAKASASSAGVVGRYTHAIRDQAPLTRWSSPHVTLIGDACHAVTPNNGQGACMAIEDAIVLATLLKEHWGQPDGHVEAFYQYERARASHCAGVYTESHKQMRLGQLTSKPLIWIRNLVLSVLPARILERKLRHNNTFAMDEWLARFNAARVNA